MKRLIVLVLVLVVLACSTKRPPAAAVPPPAEPVVAGGPGSMTVESETPMILNALRSEPTVFLSGSRVAS